MGTAPTYLNSLYTITVWKAEWAEQDEDKVAINFQDEEVLMLSVHRLRGVQTWPWLTVTRGRKRDETEAELWSRDVVGIHYLLIQQMYTI